MAGKVIVFGVDGATFRVIDPMIRDGRLPVFKRLMESGVRGPLASTVPAVSPVAWTSFMTGCAPAKHGIFDFAGKAPGSYRFRVNTASLRRRDPIWTILGNHGKRVFVAGVTMTYPPDKVNGYMISGLGAPTETDMDSCAWPSGFAAEVNEKVGRYLTVPDTDLRKLWKSDSLKKDYIDAIFSQVDHRVRLFRHMQSKGPFDFTMIFFNDTDGASHYFWKHMDPSHRNYAPGPFAEYIRKVYEKVDKGMGEILESAGPDVSAIVVSDHGFGPLNRVIFLNNWLASKGYLAFKDTPVSRRLMSSLKSVVKGRRPVHRRELDWGRTKAFFNGTVGNVFLNVKGREPEGIVDPSEVPGLVKRLKAELSEICDPLDNKRIVESVFDRHELNSDERDGSAPDIVAVFKSGYSVVGEEIALHSIEDKGEIIADSNNWSGTHEVDGVFIASGPGIRKGGVVNNACLADIAPTILYMNGLQVPGYMDGRALVEAFDDGFRKANPLEVTGDKGGSEPPAPAGGKGPDEGEEADEEVMKRLKGLGYID